jgi:hypothetical protein
MGSSKKHKKHKDRKHSYTSGADETSNQSFTASTPAPEQRPLKLVLKMSGGNTGSPMMSPALNYPVSIKLIVLLSTECALVSSSGSSRKTSSLMMWRPLKYQKVQTP